MNCLICGRSSEEMAVVDLTTRSLQLRLCEFCAARWRGYGLVVTPEEDADGVGLRAQPGNPASSSAAAAFMESALNGETSG